MLVAAFYAATSLFRNPTPSDIAANVLNAYERRDGHALWSLTPDSERQIYGLTENKIQSLVDVSKFGSEIVPDGKIMIQLDPPTGSATASKWYKVAGKSRGVIGVTAELREQNRAVAHNPITALIYMLLYASGSKDNVAAKPLIYLKGLENEASKLETMGFAGVANDDCTALISWPELKAQFEARYTRYQQLHSDTR